MTVERNASNVFVEVRVLVFFQGGHLLATYKIVDDPVTWDADLEACVRDALTRASAWPFLWVSARAKGRVAYQKGASDLRAAG